MALWQGRSRRKPTGGRYRPFRKKRKFEIGREQQYAFVGPQKLKLYRTKGGNQKVRILNAEFANVIDPKTGKTAKSKIVTVKESPGNPHFVTRNIVTRGAVIQTEAGLARGTSGPRAPAHQGGEAATERRHGAPPPPLDLVHVLAQANDVPPEPDQVVREADVLPRAHDLALLDPEDPVPRDRGEVPRHVALVPRVPGVREPEAVLALLEDLVPRPVPRLAEQDVGLRRDEARVARGPRLEFLRGRGVVEVRLQDPLLDDRLAAHRRALRGDPPPADRLRGTVVRDRDGLGGDPLPEPLRERGQARHHAPRVRAPADLVNQGGEDEGVEHDVVPARLPAGGGLRGGRDLPRLLARLRGVELGEAGRARDPVAAGLEGDQGPDREVQGRPVVVPLDAVRGPQVVLLVVLPEGPCALPRALLERAVHGGLDVVGAVREVDDPLVEG